MITSANIRKGALIYLYQQPGIVIRRQGAHHVRVKTERVFSTQDFTTHAVTECRGTRQETWPLSSVTTAPVSPLQSEEGGAQ